MLKWNTFFNVPWSRPKYIEEGMAILLLFTFWRGWGHDVIVIHQLSKQEGIAVKILHFHGLVLYSDFVFEYSENKN